MKSVALAVVLIGLLVLAACAPAPNELVRTAGEEGKTAGFWQGLWHGFIAPFTFIASLFRAQVGIYEAHNNGNWYNFGFLLGASIIMGGSGRGSARARRRKDQ